MNETNESAAGGSRRLVRSEKHTINRYVYMYDAAERFVALAKDQRGTYLLYSAVASIAFSAFCLEGFLNALGSEKVPFWSAVERKLEPKTKLILLADRSGVPINWGQEPWQSFSKAFQIRNLLAHPRRETFDLEYEVVDSDEPSREPQGDLEKLGNIQAAETILAQTRELVLQLWTSFGYEGDPLASMGEFEGIETVVPDKQ